MGSSDSPANAHGVGSSCGLVGSLFPNSCRGRAESFARRLHRRLTSLGGEANSSDDAGRGLLKNATETSWLHGSTAQKTSSGSTPNNSGTSLSDGRVHDCQPRHSPESDIYYDFDIEPEDNGSPGTISPVEMANAAELAKILVNPTILKSNHNESCHCSPGLRPPDSSQADSESSYVFSSPLAGLSPDTDNSEVYFDPDSSETEKSRAETFFDPQATSESDAASNGPVSAITGKFSTRRRRVAATNDQTADDNSESSSSSCNIGTLEGERPPGLPLGCSSEESINGRSSLETTSPSHESLWSTFDDSTMSLQDESPSALGSTGSDLPTRLLKSHSDSEVGAATASDGFDEVDLVDERSTWRSSINIPGGCLVMECPSGGRIPAHHESVDTEVDSRTEELYENEDMSKLMDRLACNPNVDAMLDGLTDEVEAKNGGQIANGEDEDEADEEEEDGPQRLRRCSSLKTGKTPPGTPGRKKIVRFADVLGLDLADVRTFLDEIPKVPNSAYSDLIYDESFQKDTSPVNFWGTGPATFTTPLFAATIGPKAVPTSGTRIDRILVPLFQQPAGSPSFLDLVRERRVCLENVVVQDPVTMCLQGTVRVRNLDFHKSVHVRYSLDSWRNFSDLQATYAPNSCDGFSDKFTFSLYCHTLKVGQRLEMAVRFQCKGTQYWDNNAGVNYCFQCLPATSLNTGSYIPITTPTVNHGTRDWSPTFY